MDTERQMNERTAMKSARVSASFALLGVVVTLASCRSAERPRPAERPTEVVEIAGPVFPVRISAFPEENGGFVPGAYYRFESLPGGSTNWVRAMEFRHDDPVPIPKQNVRFLAPKSAFVYMGWRYAVTTDAGRHWHVWSAEKDLPGWQCCNYVLIKEIKLEENGAGRMILSPIQGRKGEVPELVTSDFGAHWAPPQAAGL